MLGIKKLLVLLISSSLILSTFFLSLSFYNYSKNMMIELIVNSRNDSLSLVSQKVDSLLSSAKTISNLLERDDQIYGTLLSDNIEAMNIPNIRAQIDQTYIKYYESFNQFDMDFYIIFIAKNGFRYSSKSEHTDFDFEKIQSMSWFTKNIANRNDSYFTANFNDYDQFGNNHHTLTSVKNLRSTDGEYAGSILLCIPEESLLNMYLGIDSNSSIYILDELSRVISSKDTKLLGTIPFELQDYQFVRGKQNYQFSDNNFFYAKYTSEDTGWTILEEIPMAIVQDPIDNLVIGIAAFFLFSCGFSIIISIYIANKISKPLSQFCDAMENSIDNKFEHVTIKSSFSEIKTICIHFNQLTTKIKKLLHDIKEKEFQVNKTKFDFLRAQINPHFLYNTLFSIKCTVSMGKINEGSEMITILISMLKKSIESDLELTSLIDEINYINNYMKLQRLRYGNQLTLSVDISNELLNYKILRFILQPLIENAIVHGFQQNNPDGLITISVYLEADDIIIQVHDNGVGLTQERFNAILNNQLSKTSESKSSHIGLVNINDRVHLNYGHEYGLFLDCSMNVGTCICIRLPRIT